jgi:hypothetical protein
VIDASIAQAAGGQDAVFPTSKHCRDFLQAVLRICNHVVFTSAILTEWKNHSSNSTRKWRRSMVAHKKVDNVDDSVDENLKSKILRTADSDKDRNAMEKDFHLLDAALKADKIVISLDNTVFRLFAVAGGTVGEIREVSWVNPAETPGLVIKWLENGTPQVEAHKLKLRTP